MSRTPCLSIACVITGVLLSAPASAEENEKAGPWMANFKIGPAIEVSNFSETQLSIQLDGGYAVVGEHGYFTFSPQFGFGDVTSIWLPVGFQYDIALPIENVYLYPRASVGFAYVTRVEEAGLALIPEVGLKYQFHPHGHVGVEPVSLPIGIGKEVWVQYRLAFHVGGDF